MALNWGDVSDTDHIPRLLNSMNYKPSTFNSRKTVLNAFCEWLVRKKQIEYNPLQDTKSRKRSSKLTTRKRLSDEEINLVLEAIKNDQFLPKHSFRFQHSHYYPFFKFMAITGVRPAEAIGLLVKKIDFANKVVTIDQALARTRMGTSAKNRIMKSTKMEDSRELPFHENPDLENLLLQQCEGRDKNDLVFPSPTGLSCDEQWQLLRNVKPTLSFALECHSSLS